MEQFSLFTVEPTEAWVYEHLYPSLLQIIMDNNLSVEKLRCDSGKFYSSVKYNAQVAFRICLRDDYHYFGIPDELIDEANEVQKSRITKDAKSAGFTNFDFSPDVDGIQLFASLLDSALNRTIDSISKEFDCCSRFEQCSDARKCVNPNPDIAAGCGYRKILKKGKIYYGKNRNIG